MIDDKIELLNKLVKLNADEEAAAKAKAKAEFEAALAAAETLQSRMDDIVRLANECLVRGFEMPKEHKNAYYIASFYADGIHHDLGFALNRRDNRVYGLAIMGGGFCGPWDFYGNANEFWEEYETDPNRVQPPSTKILKRFYKEFPAFETAFYNWFNALTEKVAE